MNQATFDYIQAHRQDDTAVLALHAPKDSDIDMPLALQQIEGWQIARKKLPSWANNVGLLYPPKLSMEQCSSEPTARYKAEIVVRLQNNGVGNSAMVDLTGGMGVDFSFIARHFDNSTYVERQATLCASARHNFPLLGLRNTTVINGDGVEYLHSMPSVDLIYIDPSRRDDAGRRTYAIADCRPDVALLAKEMLEKSRVVLIKLSPMLDWHEVVQALPSVAEVHIVATGNECKELLVVLLKDYEGTVRLFCTHDGDTLEPKTEVKADIADKVSPEAGMYLFEPNAAIMKSGCFGWIEKVYGVGQIAPNTHLFISAESKENFPGRKFKIENVSAMSRKELRRNLTGISKANVAVRNFPMSADTLRRRLGLGDGGDVYIFGITLADKRHVVIFANKY